MPLIADPYRKVYTEDLYPDDGEIGNAFWGYHVTNNFARMYGVEGTAIFPANAPAQGIAPNVRVDLSKLQLRAAPIVQIVADTPGVLSTTYAVGVLNNTIGNLEYTYPSVAGSDYPMKFTATLPAIGYYPLPQPGDIFKVGEAVDEIFRWTRADVFQVGQDANYTMWDYHIFTDRAQLNTLPQNHVVGEKFYNVDETSVTYGITPGRTLQLNPNYVVSALHQNSILEIFWLNNTEGTIHYKVFGA